jgi:subtilisin family serine protease
MRRRLSIPFVAALALVLSVLATVPGATTAGAETTGQPHLVPVTQATAQAVPGSYIVTVRDGIDPRIVAVSAGVVPTFVYTHALNGFAGQIGDVQLNVLQQHPDVVAIEQDQLATTDTTQGTEHGTWNTWGLDRIDQRALPLTGTYTYTSTGTGVDVYVFDTGIRYSHTVFGGRASLTYDAFGGDGSDCNGHGSHVSGTIGGATLGVAVNVRLHSVRVLDCSGSGPVSGIISGIDVVRASHGARSVANMSLGLNGISSAFNTSVSNLIASGVFTAVAAGNSSQDACNFSPSSVSTALTVAASDRNDKRATFSNTGACVDLYGPGVDVWSSWYTSDTTVALVSGTSQATPHAAGVAALYEAATGISTPSSVHAYLVNNATVGVITANRTGTPNRLLYTNSL